MRSLLPLARRLSPRHAQRISCRLVQSRPSTNSCHATRLHGARFGRTRRSPLTTVTLAAALSPAAFIRMSEEEDENGETSEERMLEASREELANVLPDDLRGIPRLRRRISILVDTYIIEPTATVFRFLYLVIIFVPVIAMVPVIWLGRRVKERGDERSGTLWWYQFLVNSMERAGPAFIKVSIYSGRDVH